VALIERRLRPHLRVLAGATATRVGFLDAYGVEAGVALDRGRRWDLTARYRPELIAYVGSLDRFVTHTVALDGRLRLRHDLDVAGAASATTGEDRDALAVLAVAATPAAGRALSTARLVSVLRKAGRQRNLQARAQEISTALRAEHLGLSDALTEAYGVSVTSLVAVLTTMVAQAAALEGEVERCFGQHPDAEIITSQPGLGVVLGARVLAEFGDDKDRYADAKARRNYAGTSPITKTSGKSKVVLARYARNKRLADALHQQAFSALSASPGARAFYDHHRARGATHHQALRALSNRLVGILDGCLRNQTTYDETTAWAHRNDQTLKIAS